MANSGCAPLWLLRQRQALAMRAPLGRDDDGDLTFSAALFFVTYDLVVTTWPDAPPSLRQWAALDKEAG